MSAVSETTGLRRSTLATPEEIAAARARRKLRENSRKTILYAMLILGAIIFMCPLYWMLITAVKTNAEAYLYPPSLWPQVIKLVNFPDAWNYEGMQFTRWTLQTIFITVAVMVGVLLTSSMCAYGFARMRFPGRNFWFIATLASTMLPAQVTLIPLYIVFFKIGWLDTYNPLIIPAWFGGGAINIFLLRQFFMGIPTELEDAALIDGAGRFRIWWSIFMPLSIPAVLTVAIFTFQGVWNDFYGPLVYITSQDNYTLALGINLFKGIYGAETQYLMAVSTLMTIPMIVLFFVAQRYFIRGIVLTGINR
ncbi:MAG: carbohydrate ABC transporter permease [Chloroflexi bacterium]|nr:carbohydrate ABC transporter permease [Chloroflexota bacterium]